MSQSLYPPPVFLAAFFAYLPVCLQRIQDEGRKQAGVEAKRVAEANKKAGQARQQLEIAVKASAEVSRQAGS